MLRVTKALTVKQEVSCCNEEMTKKQKTFALLVTVVIVWGTIIYKIIDATSTGDDTELPAPTSAVKEPYNDYAIPKDTTHLLLTYKDPFGLKKQKDTVRVARVMTQKIHKEPVPKAATNWNFIRYSGYINNPGSKKTVALLSINGRSVMLSEGESAESVKLIKNMRDSIKVSYNGQIKFITIR